MSKQVRILYAGDSGPDGAARYLLGILHSMRAVVTHIPPSQKLSPRLFHQRYDVILLSDFPRKHAPSAAQKAIEEQVRRRTGLMMVGGWASFSGPFGGWRGSLIEKLLPVICASSDDRVNFPGGAYPVLTTAHPMFAGFSFKNPPAIVGANDLRVRKSSEVILSLQKIVPVGSRLTMDPAAYPLLVVDRDPQKRVAAYASDFAPHWCGGLVDWGDKTLRLSVGPGLGEIEVGNRYVRFLSALILWLSGRR